MHEVNGGLESTNLSCARQNNVGPTLLACDQRKIGFKIWPETHYSVNHNFNIPSLRNLRKEFISFDKLLRRNLDNKFVKCWWKIVNR